ncbi:MAG: hypothetical protein ACYC6L_14865 [Anaerolineae bacterium]
MQEGAIAYWERVGNLHIHTLASDGSADHTSVAQAAAKAGLDFIIITDHDVYLPEMTGWKGSVLLLVGEELQALDGDEGYHYLVLNANREMVDRAGDPQQLIDAVNESDGQGYIAHPFEYAGFYSGERTYGWGNWDVTGFNGIEIWNYMSEFKAHISNLPKALTFVFFPKLAIRGPFAATLAVWDKALIDRMVWAVGGSDAHAHTYRKGPLKRQVFSYEHLFKSVNMHLLLTEPWTGEVKHDSNLVYAALAQGKSFIAYDALAPARGFDFTAVWQGRTFTMGDTMEISTSSTTDAVRIELTTPYSARLRLLCNGLVIAQSQGTHLLYTTQQPGVYRAEASQPYFFTERAWIFSNPIRIIAK